MISCTAMRLVLVSALLGAVAGDDHLAGILDKYFNSDISQSVVGVWNQNKLSYENSLKRALVSDVGRAQANIFVVEPGEHPLALAPAFLAADGVIELLLSRLTLRALPLLQMEPQVEVSVPNGFVSLYASLREMFVDAPYVLFRNASVVQRRPAPSPLRDSPFAFQQVKKEGNVTMRVEDCSLSGHAALRMDGVNAKVGLDTLRLHDCKYSVEIDNGLETPPVIAPYFSEDIRKELNRIISRPVREMIMSKLQAFFFSNMNLTSVFQDKLDSFRKKQAHVLDKTAARLVAAAGRLNRVVTQTSGGTMSVAPAEIAVAEQFQGRPVEYKFTISDMTLNGLESAYSSSSWGPISDGKVFILERIKYDVLQVQGQVQYSDAAKNSHQQRFLADLRDVALAVSVEPETSRRRAGRLRVREVYGLGWRKIDLSITNLMRNNMNRQFVYDLIAGYLESAIMVPLGQYISNVYDIALDENADIPTDPPYEPTTCITTDPTGETTCVTTDETTCVTTETDTTPCYPTTPQTTEPPTETTCITTDPPTETTCVTTDPPTETTCVTTDPPTETTCVTTDPPTETTCVTTDPPTETTCVTTDPPTETTCVTTDSPTESTCYPSDTTTDTTTTTDPNSGVVTTCVTTNGPSGETTISGETTTTSGETTTDFKPITRCTTDEPINVRSGVNIETDEFEVKDVGSNELRH